MALQGTGSQISATEHTTANISIPLWGTERQHVAIGDDKAAVLRSIWDFLNVNTEVVRLRQKQMIFFTEYALERKLTLAGLLELPQDISGERVPTHILTLLQEAVREEMESSKDEMKSAIELDDRGAIALSEFKFGESTGTSDGNGADEWNPTKRLQSKRIPFDSLGIDAPSSRGVFTGCASHSLTSQLLPERDETGAGGAAHRAAARRAQQPVILCASLLSKVANLAGIARTCEVFRDKRMLSCA